MNKLLLILLAAIVLGLLAFFMLRKKKTATKRSSDILLKKSKSEAVSSQPKPSQTDTPSATTAFSVKETSLGISGEVDTLNTENLTSTTASVSPSTNQTSAHTTLVHAETCEAAASPTAVPVKHSANLRQESEIVNRNSNIKSSIETFIAAPEIQSSLADSTTIEKIPEDSVLKRHYLSARQIEAPKVVTESSPPTVDAFTKIPEIQLSSPASTTIEKIPEDSVLRRHYFSARQVESAEIVTESSPAPVVSLKLQEIRTKEALPEDSILKRHFLSALEAKRLAISNPYPTDSVLRRHYENKFKNLL